jgi:beta-lactamase class D
MNTTINRGKKEREGVGWLVGWGVKSQSEIDYSMRADFKRFKGEDNQKNTVGHFLQTYSRLNIVSLPQPKDQHLLTKYLLA